MSNLGHGPMLVKCTYPDCGHRNAFEEEDRGTEIYCDRCGRAVFVPDAPAEASTSPRAKAAPPPDDRLLWQFSLPAAPAIPLAARNGPAADAAGRIYAPLHNSLAAIVLEERQPRLLWEYPTGGVIPGSAALHTDGSLRIHSGDGKLHAIDADGRPLWPPVPVGKPLSSATPLVDADGQTWVSLVSGGLAKVDARGSASRVPYFSSPARFNCPGILWGQTLVIGSEDHFLHAIDLRGSRGADLWDWKAGDGDTGWYLNVAPAVASGPVFVVATSRSLLCGFDLDGKKRWEVPLPGLALGAPVVDGEDRVYVGVTQGETRKRPRGLLVCYDIRRGEIVWQTLALGAVESTPVLGADGFVYFGDNAGWIHALDRAGQLQWSCAVGHPVRSCGTLAAPNVLVFGDDRGVLVGVRCDSTALAKGWPKSMGSLQQTGFVAL